MCQTIITEYSCSHFDVSSPWTVLCNSRYNDESYDCIKTDQTWRSGFMCPSCAKGLNKKRPATQPQQGTNPDCDDDKHDSVIEGSSDTSSIVSPASSMKRKRSMFDEGIMEEQISTSAAEPKHERIVIRLRFTKKTKTQQKTATASKEKSTASKRAPQRVQASRRCKGDHRRNY